MTEPSLIVYAQCLWNELPNKTKAADGVQNLKTAKNIILKGIYLTVKTIHICPLTSLYKALLYIKGGKGTVSNINYSSFSHFWESAPKLPPLGMNPGEVKLPRIPRQAC